jgi:formate transporter
MQSGFDARGDALTPAEMAVKAEQIGIRKAKLNGWNTFISAILAGAFIAVGGMFATTVAAGADEMLPYGVTRLLSGLAFSLGLVAVLVGGAELFTGNTLMVMALAGHKIDLIGMLRNWGIVYAGNLIGSLVTALLSFWGGQYVFAGGVVGVLALTTATVKTSLGFFQAVVLGILANALVCLAVWLTYSARTTSDRILAIVFPISAFVAAGYEHSVANMYLIPIGLLIKDWAPATFWTVIGKSATDFTSLTWSSFIVNNLIPVTIGNIIGGSLLVGIFYWFVYLRKSA